MIMTARSSLSSVLVALILSLVAFPALSSQSEQTGTKTVSPTASIPGPSFEDVLSLRSIGSVSVSADGDAVAYVVTNTDWEDNSFTREIWVKRGLNQADQAGSANSAAFQLTNSTNGSSSPQFAPSGTKLGFLSDRGDGSQIFVIDTRGGESKALTAVDGSVSSFQWSPDATRIAFTTSDEESDEHKARKKKYGAFAVEDEELTFSHLWVQDIPHAVNEPGDKPEAKQLTSGKDFSVGSFNWSPDGTTIAFDHRPRPVIDDFVHSDISLVEVSSSTVRSLVHQDGPDSGPMFSPDGQRVAFSGSFGNNPYYGNSYLATIAISDSSLAVLATPNFDENPNPFAWTDAGIWFTASQKTERTVFQVPVDSDGQPGPVKRAAIALPKVGTIIGSIDISNNGQQLAFIAQGPERIAELYSLDLRPRRGKPAIAIRHTQEQDQVDDWPLGTREVVRWESKDGTLIEGILLLPENHDRSKPAPLLVVIHGGPTGTSRPTLVSRYVYPVTQWLAKGTVILMPNYRGSAGYGAKFRALNVGNLGIGDAWDVEAGVQHLINQGLADKDRVGAMGWSQGGYISAFLATTSHMFKALSNGAGISDWMTYYVNTDIHGFTRSYLGDTPWESPDAYARTSPITYIKRAKTPTLIQHGENDGRVPVPNAYELYQGLKDQGVDTKLVIYKGFGHGITKPKERLAAMWHNWQWFAKYIWNEEVALPVDVDDNDDANEDNDSADGDPDSD